MNTKPRVKYWFWAWTVLGTVHKSREKDPNAPCEVWQNLVIIQAMDEREAKHPPKNPLLPFLEKLSQAVPKRWDNKLKKYVTNDDWLLWELDSAGAQGETVIDTETP